MTSYETNYATYGDDPEFESEYPPYEEPVDETRRDLDELFSAVDDLRRALQEADTREQGLRGEVAELTRKLERREGGTRRHEGRLETVGRQVERVQQQLQALERAVRVAEGVPVIQLDDVDAPTRRLAAEAGRWDELERQLATKAEREEHEIVLRRHKQLLGTLDDVDAKLFMVITRIAETDRRAKARGPADTEFAELAHRRRTLLDDEIPAASEAADEARRALAEADATEARIVPQLERAERAWADLQTALRARITDALGSSALLPLWFSTSLGVCPPPGSAGDDWLRTASSVLAYRISYGIGDQALPLGAPPASEVDPAQHRWAWRAKLEAQLAELD